MLDDASEPYATYLKNQVNFELCCDIMRSVESTFYNSSEPLPTFVTSYKIMLDSLTFMPIVGTDEYDILWKQLIKLYRSAIFLIPNATEEMLALHKMIWEV